MDNTFTEQVQAPISSEIGSTPQVTEPNNIEALPNETVTELDPWQLEGMSPEQKQQAIEQHKQKTTNEPPPTHPRFQQIYGKWKESERKEQALAQEIQMLKNQQQELYNRFQQQQTIPQVPIQNEPSLDDQINQLKQERLRFADEMDIRKVAEIDERLIDLKVAKIAQQNNPERIREEINRELKAKEEAYAVDTFKQRNVWFDQSSPNFDPQKASYAAYLDMQLMSSYPQMPVSQRLQMVESKVNEMNAMPMPTQVPQQRWQPSQMVEPARNIHGNSNPTYGLSQQEMDIARKMFPDKSNPYEIYAKNK